MDATTPQGQADAPPHEPASPLASTMDDAKNREVPDLAAQLSVLERQLEVLQARMKDTNKAQTNAADSVNQGSIIESSTSGETAATSSVPHENTKGVRIREDPAEPETTETAASESFPAPKVIIPRLNRVRWTEFKNTSLDEEGYAIDVLIGPARFYWEKHKEQRKVLQRGDDQQGLFQDVSSSYNSRPLVEQLSMPKDVSQELVDTQSEMPERIRINCERLLMVLREITDSALTGEPIVLLRPYKLLIHHEDAIRQWLQDLEVKWPAGSREAHQYYKPVDSGIERPLIRYNLGSAKKVLHEGDSGDTIENAAFDTHDVLRKLASSRDFMKSEVASVHRRHKEIESYAALTSLRCLVQFMDSDLIPVCQRYQANVHDMIRFRDLWYLYRPGDIVVSWKDLDKTSSTTHGTSWYESVSSGSASGKGPATLWRVLQVTSWTQTHG